MSKPLEIGEYLRQYAKENDVMLRWCPHCENPVTSVAGTVKPIWTCEKCRRMWDEDGKRWMPVTCA